ncbi:DUF928 domain-containing protein [Tolypothrix bouteillei VB521301_2]|uniref:DUF928 domain-containing protein n=1 Tax=Tolypothrix bouteillei VB521301 TaxID=1479485 RepID=A0A0C1R2H2_9CYAN
MKWILSIVLVLIGVIYYPAKVTAQTNKPEQSKKPATTKQPVQSSRDRTSPPQRTSRPVFAWPKTPERLGPVSGRRAGMGSRGNCPTVATALTALVPLQEEQRVSKQTDKPNSGIVKGLTTSERPTFWFYVPYTKDLTAIAEFILQDSAGNDIYKNAVPLPAKPGVISVSLSSDASLQIGKTYRWYLKVRCDRQQTVSVPIYVEGDIQRVNLDSQIVQQLEATADPRQKAVIYAANGIWFDSLNMLAQMLLSNPDDASVAADWQSLLSSVNLGNVSTAALVK